ncbi:hypothetical protein [Ruegeria lacuscaerulensis]|uniref:hypothetical protein n=1 Tax=Ruegeria lacuscaerulensis TaxID=55218 RepID=UPI00147DE952|nr:hypothetical protein [Ruegeria lacuscaerulensis]
MSSKWQKRRQKWRRSVEVRVANIQYAFSNNKMPDHCIIVASNGRSGSTLTFNTLQESFRRRSVRRAEQAAFVARLKDADLSPPSLYKTHDFPDVLASKPEGVRVIFCFGPTKDSAFSVYSARERYGQDWLDTHFSNLNATGEFDDLFNRDVLQQARQIKEWATFVEVPVLCVRYDAIWDHQHEIAEFTGFAFVPPERIERAPKSIPAELLKAANTVYDPIDKVIAELPKCFVASKEFAPIVDKLPLR